MRGEEAKRGASAVALAARGLVSIYWVTLAVFGCARLWREGWGSALAVIHAWYLAALVFLLVCGPVVVVASLASARGDAKIGRKPKGVEGYRLRG